MKENDKEQAGSYESKNFLQLIIEEDLKNNKNGGRVHTRFPPEPNGYLHIGHAKSICLNFGLAKKYNGKCNLRFDDTNPVKEDVEYVDSIKEDVKWLGFQWDGEYYASDYFQQLYDYAVQLIKDGKAYVCQLSAEEIAATKGTPTTPGKESPYRNRSVEENLDLFQRMRNGEFAEGTHTLRAKIDMAAPNMHFRDPLMYRIIHADHHRTGNKWCIYPMYDYAHGQSDFIEAITHSICTLEFEVHRPLYDWFLDALGIDTNNRPHQNEFARLNLSYTVMSKRKLLELVKKNYVSGWDDPRMPTICGLRSRGYTPESLRNFADTIGVAKRDNIIDVSVLEHCVREDLNKRALRAMAVLKPLKLVITNYPENQKEELEAVNNPEDTNAGTRKISFSKVLYIEQDDFMENAPAKYFRMTVGAEVRLKYAYIVKCTNFVKDANGNIVEVHCEYDPETKSGSGLSNKKVKGTIHWVDASTAVEMEVRLFDRLFNTESPDDVEEGKDFKDNLNPKSLEILDKALGEAMLANAKAGDKFQFERMGYFCLDKDTEVKGKPCYNKTVGLKDGWAKIAEKK